jgi:hypothetical protein
MNFYEGIAKAGEPLQQGDVFAAGLLFPTEFNPFSIAPYGKKQRESVNDSLEIDGQKSVKLTVHKAAAIVISQTCDVQVRKKKQEEPEYPQYVSVAAVFPVSDFGKPELLEGTADEKKFWGALKPYTKISDRPDWFYLPGFVGPNFKLSRSLVSLLKTQTLSGPECAKELIDRERIRLSSEALGLFQLRLLHLFGRFAASDELLRFGDCDSTPMELD